MTIRHDWTHAEVRALFDLPFNDLLFRAHQIHRDRFDPNAIQVSTLLSVKTGACSEDCGYCSQSAHHSTGIKPERLMSLEEVAAAAANARDGGATRFCMSAAWRSPVRLVGISVFEMAESGAQQLKLNLAQGATPESWERVSHAVDRLRRRYGAASLVSGAVLDQEGE